MKQVDSPVDLSGPSAGRPDDLHIVVHSRGTSIITPGRGHLRRVSATTELTSISGYPPAVAYNRNHSYTTRDQASQFNLFPQPIYPPGGRQINKAANMSTTEKPKDKLEGMYHLSAHFRSLGIPSKSLVSFPAPCCYQPLSFESKQTNQQTYC